MQKNHHSLCSTSIQAIDFSNYTNMKRKANDSFGPEAVAELDVEPSRKRAALEAVDHAKTQADEFREGLFSHDAVDQVKKNYVESNP